MGDVTSGAVVGLGLLGWVVGSLLRLLRLDGRGGTGLEIEEDFVLLAHEELACLGQHVESATNFISRYLYSYQTYRKIGVRDYQ